VNKLIKAVLESSIPKSLKTAIGVALFLVLLRVAGVSVGEYVDESLKFLLNTLPGLRTFLRSMFVFAALGSVSIPMLSRYGTNKDGKLNWKVMVSALLWMAVCWFLIYSPPGTFLYIPIVEWASE